MSEYGNIPEEHIKIYKDALKVAYSDGSLDDDGELMLNGLRQRYDISTKLHNRLMLDVFIYLGEHHKEQGDLEEALKWFKVLVNLDKYDELAWRYIGGIYTDLSDYPLAGKALKKAKLIVEKAKKDPNFSERVERKKKFYARVEKESSDAVAERKKRGEDRKRRRREKRRLREEEEKKAKEEAEEAEHEPVETKEEPEVFDVEEPAKDEEPEVFEVEAKKEEIIEFSEVSADEEKPDVFEVEEPKPKKKSGKKGKGKKRKGKKGGKGKAKKAEDKDTMPCPKCKSIVTIPSKKRPVVVKCDNCGSKGKLVK